MFARLQGWWLVRLEEQSPLCEPAERWTILYCTRCSVQNSAPQLIGINGNDDRFGLSAVGSMDGAVIYAEATLLHPDLTSSRLLLHHLHHFSSIRQGAVCRRRQHQAVRIVLTLVNACCPCNLLLQPNKCWKCCAMTGRVVETMNLETTNNIESKVHDTWLIPIATTLTSSSISYCYLREATNMRFLPNNGPSQPSKEYVLCYHCNIRACTANNLLKPSLIMTYAFGCTDRRIKYPRLTQPAIQILPLLSNNDQSNVSHRH